MAHHSDRFKAPMRVLGEAWYGFTVVHIPVLVAEVLPKIPPPQRRLGSQVSVACRVQVWMEEGRVCVKQDRGALRQWRDSPSWYTQNKKGSLCKSSTGEHQHLPKASSVSILETATHLVCQGNPRPSTFSIAPLDARAAIGCAVPNTGPMVVTLRSRSVLKTSAFSVPRGLYGPPGEDKI